MTPYDAIIAIKLLKPDIEWDLSLEYQEALDEAITALEKQIPKPAKRKNHTRIEYCASCGRVFDRDDYFCWYCGQRIER